MPYQEPVGRVLQSLFLLEVALLMGGLIFGKPGVDATGSLPRALRLLLSTLLVCAAFLGWWRGASGTSTEGYAALILVGMFVSFLGDLIMARVIRVPNRLLAGMGAFGLGHVAYSAACLQLLQGLLLPVVGALAPLLVMWTLAVVAWYALVRKPGGSDALNVASLGYSLLNATMVALTVHLAIQDRRFSALATGSLLFVVSDLVLGNWAIRGNAWRSVNDVVWATYVTGQLLIVYSVAPAIAVLP